MGARSFGLRTCEVCGLKIQEWVTGWRHLGTQAGRRQEDDHRARPVIAPSTDRTEGE